MKECGKIGKFFQVIDYFITGYIIYFLGTVWGIARIT